MTTKPTDSPASDPDSPVDHDVAAAYDGDDPESDDPFVPTEAGRTAVDGLYVAGWMSDETANQVGVNAGHDARAGLALARDDMSDRYWLAVGEQYVDWVVHDGRYGGDGWADHVEEWFDAEMRPDDRDLDLGTVEAAREDLKAEFLGRYIDEDERRCRDRAGQRRLLERLDEDIVREYVDTLEATNHDN